MRLLLIILDLNSNKQKIKNKFIKIKYSTHLNHKKQQKIIKKKLSKKQKLNYLRNKKNIKKKMINNKRK